MLTLTSASSVHRREGQAFRWPVLCGANRRDFAACFGWKGRHLFLQELCLVLPPLRQRPLAFHRLLRGSFKVYHIHARRHETLGVEVRTAACDAWGAMQHISCKRHTICSPMVLKLAFAFNLGCREQQTCCLPLSGDQYVKEYWGRRWSVTL